MKRPFTKPAGSGNNGGSWEVAHNDDIVLVRDSEDEGKGPVLEYTRAQWCELVTSVKNGGWPDWVTVAADGVAVVKMPGIAGPFLTFGKTEMDTFAEGVNDGEPALVGA